MHITEEKTEENLRNNLDVNSSKFSSLIPQMGQVPGVTSLPPPPRPGHPDSEPGLIPGGIRAGNHGHHGIGTGKG